MFSIILARQSLDHPARWHILDKPSGGKASLSGLQFWTMKCGITCLVNPIKAIEVSSLEPVRHTSNRCMSCLSSINTDVDGEWFSVD